MSHLGETILHAIGRKPIAVLARELGVTRRTVYQWLSGARRPSADHLMLLAKATGVDPHTLLANQ